MNTNLTQHQIDVLKTKQSYPFICPGCGHIYVQIIDDGKDIFTLGRKYWVHFCEQDDNLHSEEIRYCPYCGIELPPFIEMVQSD